MLIKQIEVFGLPSDYLLNQLGKKEPNVWNGDVSVERYRVIVEKIEDSPEILKKRLQVLFKMGGHTSNRQSIREEAKRLGIEL